MVEDEKLDVQFSSSFFSELSIQKKIKVNPPVVA